MLKSQQLMEQMQGKWIEIEALRQQVVAEERDFSQAEQDLVQKTLDEVRQIELAITEERKNESLIKDIDHFSQMFAQAKTAGKPNGGQAKAKAGGSLGQMFVESEEWQSFMKRYAPGGRLAGIKGFTSDPVLVKGLFDGYGLQRKELITGSSDVSAGAFVVADQSGIYEELGRYPLTLRQLIDVRQTTSDTVEWVIQTRQATESATVPEANVTTYSGSTGEVSGEKPEGVNRWLRQSATVKTIAIWKPATTRALADVPQLRGLIDSELRADVNEELENQMLNGDGIGENFTGLANTAGILAQAFTTDIAVTARMAITNLLINGRQMPTAWLMNPQDWESFDLLQDLQGQYYWGGPMRQGMKTLWGVPVAQSFFLTQGTGYLGNWRKMVLWDREQATIAVSDSHADFFIRNMVAIRCELRAAMGVIRPTAFVEVDFLSGS